MLSTGVQQGIMTRLLVIRSIKILTPLLTFKDVFGGKNVILVLLQGPPGKRRNYEQIAGRKRDRRRR